MKYLLLFAESPTPMVVKVEDSDIKRFEAYLNQISKGKTISFQRLIEADPEMYEKYFTIQVNNASLTGKDTKFLYPAYRSNTEPLVSNPPGMQNNVHPMWMMGYKRILE